MKRFFIHWPWFAPMLIFIGFLAVDAPGVRAESVDAMSKQAGNLMRRAEGALKEGDIEAAGKLFDKAEELIAEIESKHPKYPDLSDLRKSRNQLKRNFRKKQSPITLFNMMATEAKKKKKPDSTSGANDLNSLFRKPANAPGAGGAADGLKRDVEALEAEYDRLKILFASATEAKIESNDLEPVKVLITRIESFEKSDLPRLEAKLADFGRKNGASREEIEKRAESVGYSGRVPAGLPYQKLKKGIAGVATGRTAMAENLVKSAGERMHTIRIGHEFHRVDGYMGVFEYLKLAQRFDPENKKVEDSSAVIGQTIDKEILALSDLIDKRAWPGHAADAPENAETIASIALSWFKHSPEWGRRSETPGMEDNESRIPLAVAIIGPWSVEKKDGSGKPLTHGLPVLLAVQLDSEKPMSVSRVYGLTMRTRSSPDEKTRPAFDAAAIGPSCYFRPGAIK